jgi:hypothetical protein
MPRPPNHTEVTAERIERVQHRPEAFVVERDGTCWVAVGFAGPFANNADAWRHVDRNRNRTTRIDRMEDVERAIRLLRDALDELGYSLRGPGEFPIPRETAQRLEENVTRAVRLLSKIEE